MFISIVLAGSKKQTQNSHLAQNYRFHYLHATNTNGADSGNFFKQAIHPGQVGIAQCHITHPSAIKKAARQAAFNIH